MTSSSTKSLIALLPNTSFQRIGDIPVPGLLVVKLSIVNTSPFFIFFAATILFLAIAIFSRSESVQFYWVNPMLLNIPYR